VRDPFATHRAGLWSTCRPIKRPVDNAQRHRSRNGTARSILFISTYLEMMGCASTGAEANNLQTDSIFREPSVAARDLFRARGAEQNPQTDEDELLAAIVSARISEPDQVAGVLNELRVESTGHLGRLDLEEWSEMMAEMRSGGVALGSRNKLRLLVAGRSASACAWPAWADGPRRVHARQAEDSSSRTGRQGDSTSAAKQASEQEPTNEPTGTIFGVSGDSAPRAPPCDY
jgi:hypothetical protein